MQIVKDGFYGLTELGIYSPSFIQLGLHLQELFIMFGLHGAEFFDRLFLQLYTMDWKRD